MFVNRMYVFYCLYDPLSLSCRGSARGERIDLQPWSIWHYVLQSRAKTLPQSASCQAKGTVTHRIDVVLRRSENTAGQPAYIARDTRGGYVSLFNTQLPM